MKSVHTEILCFFQSYNNCNFGLLVGWSVGQLVFGEMSCIYVPLMINRNKLHDPLIFPPAPSLGQISLCPII